MLIAFFDAAAIPNYFAMLESSYPYTSGNGDDSTECLYSASEATSVKVL